MPDALTLMDGDERILGVKMREHPSQVPPGFCAGAVNLRFRDGVPTTARGTVHLPWLNKLTAGVLGRHTTNHGAGRFKDADGLVWTIRAADGAVYASRPNSAPVTVPLPAGVTLAEDVAFEQFLTTLYMFRGAGADVLKCSDLIAGFTTVPAATEVGASNMPRAKAGRTIGLRLWVLTGNDQAWASTALVPESFPLTGQFRVTDGTPDNTVGMGVFNEASLVVGKQRSVWRFSNLFGDLADIQLRPVTKRAGWTSPDSVDLGTDFWWWSQEGPASLLITEFNELQTAEGAQKVQPGNDILPLIERVNGMYASGVRMGVWNRKVYIAVPLDDADATRDEMVSGNYLAAVNTYELAVTAGRHYRFVKGANETALVNGTQTITGSGDVTAQGSTIGLSGTGAAVAVTASIKPVFKGVNTAVLVYDMEIPDPTTGASGTWQGYDQRTGIEPKFFYLSEYLGKDRLCFAGSDGWHCLYEENFDGDARPEPYVNLTVTGTPLDTNTVVVNGGATVTGWDSDVNNTGGPNRWGVVTLLATAIANLWSSVVASVDTGGYAPYGSGLWERPGTHTVKLSNGVRFYGTTGIMPAITTTGTWATLTRVFWQEITSVFTSRAYVTPARLDVKRGLKMAGFLETYRANYSVALVTDGVNEVNAAVSAKTYSRTAYTKPFNKADWVATNASNDFSTPYREDYSVLCSNSTQLRDGFGIGLHQAQSPHRFRVHGSGRSAQLRVTNNAGRLRIIALGYEAVETGKRMGVQN